MNQEMKLTIKHLTNIVELFESKGLTKISEIYKYLFFV